MTNLVSIETDASLARDLSTNGVVSTNTGAYEKYLALKKQKEDEKCMIKNMQDEIHSLKGALSEIKELLLSFKQ